MPETTPPPAGGADTLAPQTTPATTADRPIIGLSKTSDPTVEDLTIRPFE